MTLLCALRVVCQVAKRYERIAFGASGYYNDVIRVDYVPLTIRTAVHFINSSAGKMDFVPPTPSIINVKNHIHDIILSALEIQAAASP